MDRPIIDISQPLRPSLPVWPGDTPFTEERTWAYGPDCPVNVSALRLSTHSGTHADAPLHYDPAGAPIGAVDLDTYVGPARVIDLRGKGPLATPDMIAPHLDASVRRVLIRSWDLFPHDRWEEAFMAIAPDAIDLLAGRGVVLIGTDAPSIDPQDSKTMGAHLRVKAAGMHILEGLVLDDVEAGDYELIALPLKLANLDSSPVRAVLRRLPE
ncbi:arylformamidase [Allosphingosinicella flava]|uniref:Kynurenine formamidase n=2 Tax=Allosphingosinicella flava TaxID=2771430 RepID=A0A7T2GLX8_9SPHN|nr:arylformamidase [Sphingosinicella flava]QPQ56299.1 arylformamidase [Sphingosinicella flava]